MKSLAASLALALVASATAQAGSFGPPPFSNGSPLVSGWDGSYQASARAKNVTGVFRFQYSNGSQTSAAGANSWVFFVNGQVQRGTVTANINESTLDGVLDSLAGGSATNSNGSISLPIVFLNANNSSAGDFRGKMSKNGDFNGQGQLLPAPAATNQIIAISAGGLTIGADGFLTGANVISVTNATYTNIAGSIAPTKFKFKGVRTAVAATATASSSSSSSTSN